MRWFIAAALVGLSVIQPEALILTVPALVALVAEPKKGETSGKHS